MKAAVFDMDGTIVDNMKFHTQSWVELSRRLGKEVAPEVFERDLAGKKNEEILPWLLGRELAAEELARLALEKEERYRELYRPRLEPLPGFLAFLARLQKDGVKTAVATAAPPGNRTLVLDGLSLRFDAVIGAEHAPRGKPSPDIYLAAARALGVAPERCVAFEDAKNGVLSARAAGMECVAVLTTTPAATLREAGARWAVRDFTALPADLERVLFTD